MRLLQARHSYPLYAILFLLTTATSCNQSSGNENTTEDRQRVNEYGEIHPDAPEATLQWGQLAGEWECISMDLDLREGKETKWYENKATWKWEYVMGGHAVLNEWWQEDKSPNPISDEFFATGLFIFNPQTALWEAVVLNSRPHRISPHFQAKYENGQIRMHDGSGKWLVTFFDIQDDSFEWKYEIFETNGEWKSISKISAKRKR